MDDIIYSWDRLKKEINNFSDVFDDESITTIINSLYVHGQSYKDVSKKCKITIATSQRVNHAVRDYLGPITRNGCNLNPYPMGLQITMASPPISKNNNIPYEKYLSSLKAYTSPNGIKWVATYITPKEFGMTELKNSQKISAFYSQPFEIRPGLIKELNTKLFFESFEEKPPTEIQFPKNSNFEDITPFSLAVAWVGAQVNYVPRIDRLFYSIFDEIDSNPTTKKYRWGIENTENEKYYGEYEAKKNDSYDRRYYTMKGLVKKMVEKDVFSRANPFNLSKIPEYMTTLVEIASDVNTVYNLVPTFNEFNIPSSIAWTCGEENQRTFLELQHTRNQIEHLYEIFDEYSAVSGNKIEIGHLIKTEKDIPFNLDAILDKDYKPPSKSKNFKKIKIG